MFYRRYFYPGMEFIQLSNCLSFNYSFYLDEIKVQTPWSEEDNKELNELIEKLKEKAKVKEMKSSLEHHKDKVKELEKKLGDK